MFLVSAGIVYNGWNVSWIICSESFLASCSQTAHTCKSIKVTFGYLYFDCSLSMLCTLTFLSLVLVLFTDSLISSNIGLCLFWCSRCFPR